MLNHIAIMPDGNRRWAREHGMNLTDAYIFAAGRIERACEWALEHAVRYITFTIFSTENWKRGADDINAVMDAVHSYLHTRTAWYVSHGVEVRFIGRRDRLEQRILDDTAQIEAETAAGDKLTMFICVDYNGRDEIARAVQTGARTEDELSEVILNWLPEPELIVRTGGCHRLSGFMLWQCAYSELYFLDKYFPDLSVSDLDEALDWFSHQKRNFGR